MVNGIWHVMLSILIFGDVIQNLQSDAILNYGFDM